MWIKDKEFEYKIPSQPTRKHFKEIVNIIVTNNYTWEEMEKVKLYCESRNPRFNEDKFYYAIESHPLNDMDESNHP